MEAIIFPKSFVLKSRVGKKNPFAFILVAMKYLVTGAAGFIGSNFVHHLHREKPGESIIVLDRMGFASRVENLDDLKDDNRVKIIAGDIADRELVRAVLEENRIDVVVNFAAETHVDRSIANPMPFYHSNILGTIVLLDECRKLGIGRFHQVSSDEVYGDLPIEETQKKFTEDSPLHPSSPYSSSKASADLIALSYERTYGMFVTVSRCSNNYGPYQFTEKLIPLTITHILEGKSIPVYGSGLNVRDWLYVEDHCRAVMTILEKGKSGEIYNVSASVEMANIELVKMICRIMGKDDNLIEYVEDRKGHDRRYALDSSRLRALGWKPLFEFENSLKKTIDWYQAHREFWM